MKNLMNNLKTRLNRTAVRLQLTANTARQKLQETGGQFVMDNAVVFVIILVAGGVAVTLLTAYLNTDFSNLMKEKINDFFN